MVITKSEAFRKSRETCKDLNSGEASGPGRKRNIGEAQRPSRTGEQSPRL